MSLFKVFGSSRGSTSPDSSSAVSLTSDEYNVVDANISDTNYARRCGEIIALHTDLMHFGADDLLDLPRIVVIGCQSAGKSSLVEAICGIDVPRDAGTCTRCPMECSMSPSGIWSCDITLRFDYDQSGSRLSISRTEPFVHLNDDTEMEIWLRRAQAAILNPQLPAQNFARKSLAELLSARDSEAVQKFSKNTICVNVKYPEATALSFVDLPGLIQYADPADIELVKGLVEEQIGTNADEYRGKSSKNTLILMTLPISDEIENQQAVRLAKNADPRGERSIGIMTKPDMLRPGSTNSKRKWLDAYEGRRDHFSLGYYCVRLPDDDERSRNISRPQSRSIEAAFFESTPPWSEITDRGRLGIPAFVHDMSALLVELIEHNLPKLNRDVTQLLARCRQEFSELPNPVTKEPSAEIADRISKFCDAFRSSVYAIGDKDLAQNHRRQFAKFKEAILKTAPQFTACLNPEDDDEPSTPAEDTDDGPPIPTINLWDVRKVIEEAVGWELPNHVPFKATTHFLELFTSLWREPSIECFSAIFENLSKTMSRLLKIHFIQFKQLHGHVSFVAFKQLNCHKEEALRTITKTLELEEQPGYTQNTEYLKSQESVWLAHYNEEQGKSHDELQQGPRGGREANEGEQTSEFCVEIAVMAKVQAYFQIACMRIIDNIPLAIEHELSRALTKTLQESLLRDLLKDPERMESLLQEDPAVAGKRSILEHRMGRLLEIRQKLENFSQDSE